MGIVIAIDAGTTGVRAMAVDEHGASRAISYREITQHYPRPGWIEHDPEEIWRGVQETVAAVRRGSDEPVACVGITNQRETIIAWNRRTARPVHRAIVWQDRRTAERCDELTELGHLPMIRSATGLVLDPYFSATKIEWLLGGPPHGSARSPERSMTPEQQSASEAVSAAGGDLAIGTVDSWILWNLTGGASGGIHATDATNASRTLLCDISSLRWSEELCDLFGAPVNTLASILPSAGRFGVIAPNALGDLAGVPISGIAGDQQAALFGQACFHPGMVKATHGTGSFVLMNIGRRCPDPVDGLLTTVAWDLGDAGGGPRTSSGPRTTGPAGPGPATAGTVGGSVAYALEGAIFASGAAIQWLRDGLGIITEASEIAALASSAPDTGGVYVVPAFAGLGSPWWDPYARGTIVGLSRSTKGAHVARAVIESIAYQTRDVIDKMSSASSQAISQLRVDGGASAVELLLQLQADQLRTTVARARVTETTALGAAWLAGLAEGVWGSLDDLEALWQPGGEATPSGAPDDANAAYDKWLRAVDRSRGWAVSDASSTGGAASTGDHGG